MQNLSVRVCLSLSLPYLSIYIYIHMYTPSIVFGFAFGAPGCPPCNSEAAIVASDIEMLRDNRVACGCRDLKPGQRGAGQQNGNCLGLLSGPSLVYLGLLGFVSCGTLASTGSFRGRFMGHMRPYAA